MSQNFYIQQMHSMVQPMRDELTQMGVKELRTPEEVDEALQDVKGTTLLVINSVCGCAAGLARPAVSHALKHISKPDHLYTVFAGQDKEATAQARSYLTGEQPSSPSYALLKDGKLVHMIHREEIEGAELEVLVKKMTDAFDQHCT